MLLQQGADKELLIQALPFKPNAHKSYASVTCAIQTKITQVTEAGALGAAAPKKLNKNVSFRYNGLQTRNS